MNRHSANEAGFSLLELAITLIILALLAGSLLPGISALREKTENDAVRQQLDNAREALLGFVISHGRLPCPAAPGSNGNESPSNGGNCTHPWNGFLPAITLGIGPVDEHGYAIDPWGNPIRYAISTFNNPACGMTPCLSSENGVRNAWNSGTAPTPDLRVCNTAQGSTTGSAAECASGSALTKDAMAVLLSSGRNGAQAASSNDEIANSDNDRLFISHTSTARPNEYDDHVAWISANILYSRLMLAGRLP